MIRWCFDIDGVITANPPALSWLTYHLCKNENDNHVIILSWRDGSNEKRRQETVELLKTFGITYHELIMCPKKLPNARAAAYWKMKQIKELKIDIWLDDEIKSYRRDYQIDLDKLLPNVSKIWI